MCFIGLFGFQNALDLLPEILELLRAKRVARVLQHCNRSFELAAIKSRATHNSTFDVAGELIPVSFLHQIH